MLAGLLALVVLFFPDTGEAHSYLSLRQRVAVGDWKLTVVVDRFSGERRCRLATRGGNALYRHGTIAIRLPRRSDHSQAVIRVNGGAPTRWRDLVPDLARVDPGFAGDRDPGMLPIPPELLKAAQSIYVSPGFGKRARAYRIAVFHAALDRAVTLGCHRTAAFVR
ncbi:hypothetical protein ACG3SL_18615 [Sphingomonas sp. CJ20]